MKIVAIIGARAGSKSVKDKNIRMVAGKPVMVWVIEAAKGSKYIDRVVVSTDSQKYAEIAKKSGAQVPFLRPKEIAKDTSHDLEYLTHALNWLKENENYIPDIVFKVSACCPLLRSWHFDKCVEILKENPDFDSVRPVAPSPKHPYKMWKVEGNILKPFLTKEFIGLDEPYNLARQLLPKVYIHTGIIALRYKTIIEDYSLVGKKSGTFIILEEDALDIDSELDLKLAEILLKERMSKEKFL